MRRAALIIWDEVPMQHKHCFEAVHRTLCDVRGDHEALFSGLPAVLGGDFAQILPVVKNGNRASIVNACLQRSALWGRLRKLVLRQNMRLQGHGMNKEFAQWLGQLSYDPSLNSLIFLPRYIPQTSELAGLYERVFPQAELDTAHDNPEFFRSRAILTPFNDVATEINSELLNRMHGDVHLRFADNTTDVQDPTLQEYSTESLQGIRLAGLPLSTLALKIAAPVMLLRNLDQADGLNNGSRMIVSRIGQRVIAGHLQGGDHNGELRITPRIPLTSLEGDLAFILTRKQFPVRLCFAMTVNKSQGQTLQTTGLDLQCPIFTHGQLYVALSRATDVANLTVLLPESAEGKTTNIVYPEVLEHMRKDPEVAAFVAGLQAEKGDVDMIDI